MVDIVGDGGSITALILHGNCQQGCSVETVGYFSRIPAHANLYGGCKDISDAVEVYPTASGYIAKRLANSYVVWGNSFSGNDINCSLAGTPSNCKF